MVLHITYIIIGFIALIWSANKFVDSASYLAARFGVSDLIIGMVIIGFGTSAPELLVSGISSFQGNSGLAIGNAYGSNISNIGLILGTVALLRPIPVDKSLLKRELPVLVLVCFISLLLLWDLNVSRFDASVLLIIFGVLFYMAFKNQQPANLNSEVQINNISLKKNIIFLGIGLTVLLLSSRLLVMGAIGAATNLGIPDIILGLTVLAIGTSLPELATSVIAVRKGNSSMAIGNVLGSNLFNSLPVVGLSAMINPIKIDQVVFYRDVGFMIFITIILSLFSYTKGAQGKINRLEGMALLTLFLSYTTYLVINTKP